VGTKNVVKMGVQLDERFGWAQLGALPESYATAWTVTQKNLECQKGERVLVRGAGSALGRAAVNLLAKRVEARVWGTTRSEEGKRELMELGCEGVEVEGGDLVERFKGKGMVFDKLLNLVGNSVLLESLTLVKRGGKVCLAGFLGGLDPIKEFNPLLQMASGVHLSFFGSFHFGLEEFPVGEIPLKEIAQDVKDGKWEASPSKIFKFEEIGKAHEAMEQGKAGGKMVVVVE